MTAAQFQVLHAGPLVSIQDGGRFGHLRYGVTASGPMDRRSHASANVALGNPHDRSAIEVSMGGLELSCTAGALTYAVVGRGFVVNNVSLTEQGIVSAIDAGQRLSIRPGQCGSWCYLSFAGDLQAAAWLGHTSTHALTGMGGGMVVNGQQLVVDNCRISADRQGDVVGFSQAGPEPRCRVVVGPQEQHFSDAALERLLSAEFTLSNAYDRMGVKLDGPELNTLGSLSIPSEPLLKGSLQVSGDGLPTVLLADHQTTGGYPKIATIISADLDDFVQLRASDTVRFDAVTAEEALQIARQYRQQLTEYYAEIAEPRGTLEDRLLRSNLISGVVAH